MTALSTVSPRNASASALSFWRIIAEISGVVYQRSPSLISTPPFWPSRISYGTSSMSRWTIGSSNRRPMNRFTEKIVLCGLVTAWRLASLPTSRSPLDEIATMDGVVRSPSAFGITSGSPASITAMTEFVVPRSMPIVRARFNASFHSGLVLSLQNALIS